MTGRPRRFHLLQRLLHWLMAACIIAMFFIGAGMVSTITPKYLPLILVHKTLGAALLVLKRLLRANLVTLDRTAVAAPGDRTAVAAPGAG